MGDVIWYFTGTGNSLSAAKRAAAALGSDVEVRPIAAVAGTPVEITASTLGFAFPVYSFGVPRLVKEFIETASGIGAERIFAIATCGNGPGGVLAQLDALLATKGARLDAALSVTYPGNCIPLHQAPPAESCAEVIARAEQAIDAFMAEVKAGRAVPPSLLSRIGAFLFGPLHAGFVRSVRKTGRMFRAGNSCSRCGLCMRACPVANIAAGPDGKPVWGERCEGCLACLNLCPVEAIQFGGLTRGRRRYRHPAIEIAEIAAQRR